MSLTKFNYQELTEQTQAIAKEAALEIRSREKSIWESVIVIGKKLIEVKAELPHGQFLPWVAHEFQWSQATANRYMQISAELSNYSCVSSLGDLSMNSLVAIAGASAKLPSEEKPELIETIAAVNAKKLEIDGKAMTEKDIKEMLQNISELKRQNLIVEREKKTAIANLEQQLLLARNNLERLQTEDKARFDAVVQDKVESEALALSKEFDQELNRLAAEKSALERQLAELATNPSNDMKAAIAELQQAKRLAVRDVGHLEKQQAELQKQIAATAEIVDQTDKNNRAVAKFHQAIAGIHANHSELFGALVGELTPQAKSQLIEAQGLLIQLSGLIGDRVGDRPQKVVQINSKNTIEVEAV